MLVQEPADTGAEEEVDEDGMVVGGAMEDDGRDEDEG